MPFTDNDLKEWKKTLSGLAISIEIERKEFESILARLEAAEAVINNSNGQEGWWDVQKELEVWRKSKGE